jgi:hypothetical protein
MLLSSLLENHKTAMLAVVKEQEHEMQERIGRELKGHMDNVCNMHKKAIQDEVKAAITSSLKDLQKFADDRIVAGLNAGTQAIQDSITRGLEETKKKMEAEMVRSLGEQLRKSHDDLVKRVSEDQKKDDSGVGMVSRVVDAGFKGLSLKLDSQESTVKVRLNSLETITRQYHTSANAIEQVLRPLRDSVESLKDEAPLLDLVKINTSRILTIIQPPRPKGDAQIEVRLVAHFI